MMYGPRLITKSDVKRAVSSKELVRKASAFETALTKVKNLNPPPSRMEIGRFEISAVLAILQNLVYEFMDEYIKNAFVISVSWIYEF